jgi:NAD(P)-dependent dehydrogenase (short-subunit alcohol dehydrogenase family)
MTIDLTGQVAVVTGAGNGLGRSHARLLGQLGASVVVNDIGLERGGTGTSHAPADRTVREIRDAGGTAVAEYSSVATPEGGAAVVDKAIEEFGQLDILVSNAGYVASGMFTRLDWATLDAMLDVHAKGTFYVTRRAYDHMREAEYGRIVLTSSAIATWGNLGVTAYGAGKGAILGMLSVLKLEAERYPGIRINAIAPMADTRRAPDELTLPEYMSVSTEELSADLVAPVVAYLSSRECEVHGDVWTVGGGSVARLVTTRARGYFQHPITDGPLTADDVAQHVDEIRDLGRSSVPYRWQDEWDELRSWLRPHDDVHSGDG